MVDEKSHIWYLEEILFFHIYSDITWAMVGARHTLMAIRALQTPKKKRKKRLLCTPSASLTASSQ